MPSTSHGVIFAGSLPVVAKLASPEPTGSASTSRTCGAARAKKCVSPASVPPVPAPQTTACNSCPVCSQISGAVVSSCACALAGLNEIQAAAILDRAARILVLELQEQLARPGIHTAHRHQRRVADHLQYTAVSGIRHARALRGRSAIVRHGGCAPALAQATP